MIPQSVPVWAGCHESVEHWHFIDCWQKDDRRKPIPRETLFSGIVSHVASWLDCRLYTSIIIKSPCLNWN